MCEGVKCEGVKCEGVDVRLTNCREACLVWNGRVLEAVITVGRLPSIDSPVSQKR